MIRTVTGTLIVVVLMCLSGYAALFVAPDERTMHAAQRIFYFHLPSWIAMFVAFFIAVIGNIAYLTSRSPKWDWLSVAGAEVGVVCCTIGLITGPLWGKPAWGIWWTWDARLTTTFILWLLYISYLLLRLLLCVIAVLGVMIAILLERYRLERLRHEVGELLLDIESRSLDKQSGVLRERK